jgi:hypothetical protein
MNCTHDAAPPCPSDWLDHEIICPTCGVTLRAIHGDSYDDEADESYHYHYWIEVR